VKLLYFFICLIVLLNVLGCSSTDVKDETKDWSTPALYHKAKEALDKEDYKTAIKYYEALEIRDPFGRYAQQGQLEVIYAYYKSGEAESASVAADRFIKLYPNHPGIDYIYYLKGLVNFERDEGVFERFVPLDKAQRDQSATLRAFRHFSELIDRFPQSKYAEDAKKRMVYLRNSLAEHELHIARFYMKRSAFVAAANRAKRVIETYQRTPAIPEALTILAKSYKIMGLDDLMVDTLRVLKMNHPDYQGIIEVEQLVVK